MAGDRSEHGPKCLQKVIGSSPPLKSSVAAFAREQVSVGAETNGRLPIGGAINVGLMFQTSDGVVIFKLQVVGWIALFFRRLSCDWLP
jgi:hypothetical protein